MARIIEKAELSGYETRMRKYKRNVAIVISVVMIVVVIVIAFMVNSFINRYYTSYEVVKTVPRADSNTVKYESYGNKILKYSRDGASAIDQDGKAVWNGSFDMKNPSASICGKYVAIADIGGKEIYVFNGSHSDSGTKIDVLLPIEQIEVAEDGIIAVVLKDADTNKINVYNPYDTAKPLKVEKQTRVQQDGFPVDIDLSRDGTKLVTSYLYVGTGAIENLVTFYNFGEVGKYETDKMVGAQKFGKTMIPKVEFLNNNTVCAFGDDKFTLFSIKQKPKQIYTETFKTEIKSIFSSSKYVGFVLEKDAKENKYEVLVYNLDGKKVWSDKIDFEYDTVQLSQDEIIFYADMECNILRIKGKKKLHCIFDKNISYFMPINHYDLYYLIDSTNIEKIKLTED